MSHSDIKHYSVGEEIANAVTHGLGLLLSIIGLVVLVVSGYETGDPWRVVSYSVYGATLVLLYFTSTCYHSVPFPSAKMFLRKCDHAAIYLLIAGTYTPFTLINLSGGWGWTLFGINWGLAVLGIAYKFAHRQRYHRMGTLIYLGMGWLAIIAIEPTLDAIAPGGLAWLVAGGLAYTSGVAFYAWSQLPYNHAIWHAFVLCGSICHFLAIWQYTAPGTH